MGSLVTAQNCISEEIKEHLSAGNRAYFALQNVFKVKTVRQQLLIIILRQY